MGGAILRNLLVGGACLGIIMTSFLYWKIHDVPPKAQPPVKPAANPYQSAVVASGIIEAVKENISIGTPVSGIVKKVFVKVSDPVKQGDPLFELDDRELSGRLAVQQANVLVSEANLTRLKDQLARLKAVKDPRAVSQEEVRTRENDVAVAEAQLKQSIAQVEDTKLLLERLIVDAPQDGLILKNDVRVGEYLQAGSTKPFMLLGNVDQLQVRVDVDEQNTFRIRSNLPAVAFLKNNTSYTIPLSFVRIEPYVIPKVSLTGDSQERVDTRVLQLIYSFDNNQDIPIFVGQQVDVFIDTAA